MIEPTSKQIDNACKNYNSEYDKFPVDNREGLRYIAMEWYISWYPVIMENTHKDNKCYGWFGKIFGHKYEHFYEENDGFINLGGQMIYKALDNEKNKKHTHSICKRCGHIIKIKE